MVFDYKPFSSLNLYLIKELRLPPNRIGMIVDEGHDFPSPIKEELFKYGEDMWMFRSQLGRQTTRALNAYRGEQRG
jgi:hypothetical protein